MQERMKHHHQPGNSDDLHEMDLERVTHIDEMHEAKPSWMLRLATVMPIPMPITTNRIRLFVWLCQNVFLYVRTAVMRFVHFARKRPLHMLGGMAVIAGCNMLCGYFGAMLLAGGLWYVYRNGENHAA